MATKQHSAFGAWLAYVMNERRASTEKLAEKAGIPIDRIEGLIKGDISPAELADGDVFKLGEVLLHNPSRRQMEMVLKALEVHADLRNWKSTCDAGCCPWNTAVEIQLPGER
jgi:hypothetical protein